MTPSGPAPATPSDANVDKSAPTLPSSLGLEPRASAARSGRAELEHRYRAHPETGPELTGGDVDAAWESAYSVGDEAPGGDNPTPGQAVVEEVGRSLGIEYDAEEELEGANKVASRDRNRWELDPASAEDYPERTRGRHPLPTDQRTDHASRTRKAAIASRGREAR